jgi:uncharacterized membrane protein YfcA
MIVILAALGVLIGLTLGALGAGGSILAVPVLAHVAGLSAAAATATSLVAVGSAAAMGAVGHRSNVRLHVAAWFVPTGFLGAIVGSAVGRRIADEPLLLLFSGLMLVAAYRMLAASPAGARSVSAAARQGLGPATAAGVRSPDTRDLLGVAVAGLVVGVLTGLFGVGGGFVIVPALTLAVGLAMPEAIATSLVIVAANALLALVVRGVGAVDWPIAVALTVPMLAGSFLGARFARHLPPDQARRAFAVLLVVVAIANAVAVLAAG